VNSRSLAAYSLALAGSIALVGCGSEPPTGTGGVGGSSINPGRAGSGGGRGGSGGSGAATTGGAGGSGATSGSGGAGGSNAGTGGSSAGSGGSGASGGSAGSSGSGGASSDGGPSEGGAAGSGGSGTGGSGGSGTGGSGGGMLGPALGSGNPSSMGLDRHDALYCGEWQLTNPGETIYLIKGGKVVWQHAIPDNDELGDCTLTSYGTVFFNRKSYGAQEIKMDLTSGKSGEIVWEYRQDGGSEVHAVQPIGKDKVLVMQNSVPAKLMIINKTMAKTCRSGMPCVEKLWPIMGGGSVHGMFRHVRILANGNLLVPFTGALGKVVEYTQDNPPKVVWEYTDAPSAWAAVRLHNGNTLISGNSRKYLKEVTPDKQVVWEIKDGDLPGISFYTIQEAMRLKNGNTIINNWCGGGPPRDRWAAECVQVVEVTPDKKVVWQVKQWSNPNLGPGSSTQLLDEPGTPENPGELQR
jgi:hypothetical protein